MKAVRLIIAALFLVVKMFGQSSDNLGFEFGNFDNWTGYRGFCCGGGFPYIGIANGWHTLMPRGEYDKNSNYAISCIAPGGGNYSVRLGNPNAGAEAERLKTTFTVTSANANLTYMYAVILQDPPGHSLAEKPKFEVRILDNNGIQIPGDCGHYEVIAGVGTQDWQKNGDISFKDWTSVAVDLRSYIGKNMTLEFTTQDCGQDGHYGYAYIDVVMSSFNIMVTNFCQKSDKVTLIAPAGFTKYRWMPGGVLSRTLVVNNPVSGDTFTVELTNEAGCVTVLKQVLISYPYPVVHVSADTTICAGSNARLKANAYGTGISYHWSSYPYNFKSDQPSPIVSPMVTTYYFVRVENANGCFNEKSIDTIKVNVRNNLVFDLGYNRKACPGDSINLASPISALHYKWSSSPPNITSTDSSIRFVQWKTAVYFLEVSDSLCSFNDEIGIEIPTDNKIVDFCEHDSFVYLTSPYYAQSYLWSKTGAKTSWTNVYNPQNNDSIKLYMTGPSGCFTTFKYYVRKNLDPFAIAPPDTTICIGTEVALEGNGAGPDDQYIWHSIPQGYSVTSKIAFISPVSSIRMVLSTISKAGCKSHISDTVWVSVKRDAYFYLPPAMTVCFGNLTTLNPHVSNGSFLWSSSPTGYISYDSVIKIRPQKKMTYCLLHKANGCSYTNNTVIDFFRRPDVSIVDYCENDTQVILLADKQYATYDWIITKDTTPLIIVKPPFNVKYFPLHYTMVDGCSDTVYYYMNKIRNPVIHAPNDTIICINSPIEINLTGLRSGFHYYWTSDIDGFVSDSKTPVFYPKQVTWYKVKVTNEIGCFGKASFDSIKVSIDSTVITELGNDTFICKGQSVRIAPIKGTGFNMWSSDPPGFTSNFKFIYVTPKVTTRYFLQIKNNKCSGNIADLVVHLWDLPQVNAGADRKICTDGVAKLSVNKIPGASYLWTSYSTSFIDTNSTVNVRPEKTSIYFIKVVDLNGCVNKDTIWVKVYSYPKVDMGDTLFVCDGIPYYLNAYILGCRYVWNTGDTTPSLHITEPGRYGVTVNNNGCKTFDDVEIIFKLRNTILNIPNIFTPNNDGINDVYEVSVDNYEIFELLIYNRWGQEIFKSNDPNKPWDGIIDNKSASSGVYFFTLRLKLNCEELNSYNGSITLSK